MHKGKQNTGKLHWVVTGSLIIPAQRKQSKRIHARSRARDFLRGGLLVKPNDICSKQNYEEPSLGREEKKQRDPAGESRSMEIV